MVHENDSFNLIRSGRKWYGEHFDIQTSYLFKISKENIVVDELGGIEIASIARSSVNYSDNFIQVGVNSNHDFVKLFHLPIDYSTTNNFASEKSVYETFYPDGDTIYIELNYNSIIFSVLMK